MGYRSEVAVRLSEQAAEVVKIFCKLDKRINQLVNDADISDLQSGCLQWSWIKWYDGYEDIDAFNAMLDQIGSEDYGLIRLGEEIEDIDYQGCPSDFDMYVNRSIEW